MTLHGRSLVTLFKEKVDLWLELHPDIPQEEVSRVVGLVRQQPFVKKETVSFISREQAAATMKEDLGDESLLEDAPDLLRDVIRFNVQAEYLDGAELAEWRAEMTQDTAIAEIYIEAANTENVGQNLRNIALVGLIVSLLLIAAAVMLIHSTIRLALYSNRFVIKNQELVGASWEYISKPYVQRGIINGVISSVTAIVALTLLLWWLYNLMPELRQLQDNNGTLAIFIGLLITGMLISGLSTWWVVNRLLKMRIDDLY